MPKTRKSSFFQKVQIAFLLAAIFVFGSGSAYALSIAITSDPGNLLSSTGPPNTFQLASSIPAGANDTITFSVDGGAGGETFSFNLDLDSIVVPTGDSLTVSSSGSGTNSVTYTSGQTISGSTPLGNFGPTDTTFTVNFTLTGPTALSNTASTAYNVAFR